MRSKMIIKNRSELNDEKENYLLNRKDSVDWTDADNKFFSEKFISVEELKKTRQFGCLESWCKSRGQGKDYCINCKLLI